MAGDATVLLVKFDNFLDILSMNPINLVDSLSMIFENDMVNNPCRTFNEKKVIYFQDPFDKQAIFDHLIKKKMNGSRQVIDVERAKRIHWIKYFIENSLKQGVNGFWVFSYKHLNENIRTYIYHKQTKFLVVLEPTNNNEYILITAHLRAGDGITEIKRRYREKLPDLH